MRHILVEVHSVFSENWNQMQKKKNLIVMYLENDRNLAADAKFQNLKSWTYICIVFSFYSMFHVEEHFPCSTHATWKVHFKV